MSRAEEIVQSILDNEDYDERPQSRMEMLLLELKVAIESGGGGGGGGTGATAISQARLRQILSDD